MSGSNAIDNVSFAAEMDMLLPSDRKDIVVAVSGGADSMALVLLTHEYCSTHNLKLHAVSIDHKLREESSEEATIVKGWMESRGISHKTLTLEWDESENSSMESSRDKRYSSLLDYCNEVGANALLTGHHMNDNIETFFIRVSGCSGPDGLASIPIRRILSDISICRPLLSFSKMEIMATCLKFNQPWVEDPSNVNEKYQRSRVRKALKDIKEETGLTDLDLISFVDFFSDSRLADWKSVV